MGDFDSSINNTLLFSRRKQISKMAYKREI